MAQLNLFESFPLLHHAGLFGFGANPGTLRIQGVELPGSISFNNVALIYSASGTTAKTMSISFGLYSLNGSTLSLANSASQSTTQNANALSWITLVTSATQNITPGNWYFACMISTSSNSRFSFMANRIGVGLTEGNYGGIFVRGELSVSTAALPASIATSDLLKESEGGGGSYPYIVLSA